MTIGSILESAGRNGTNVATLAPSQTIREAVAVLAVKKIGAVLVVDDQTGKPVGILSERDVIRALGKSDANALDGSVGDIMTPDPVICDVSAGIDKALGKMTENRCRHLPVLDGDKVVGVVSARDIMVYMVESASRQERERIVAMIALA
ncbi:MAG: CBS domain-containing protein [Alphaproteobacteria bacterium]